MLRPLAQGIVLVAASLALATPALAGFTLPYTSDVCAGIFGPINALSDPNTWAGFVKCEDLCKVTEKDCEKYTKAAYTCEINLANDNRDYQNKQCANNVTPDAVKACRQTAASLAQGQRDGAKVDREEALSQCKLWGANCLLDCGL